jgi:hypothetical protein
MIEELLKESKKTKQQNQRPVRPIDDDAYDSDGNTNYYDVVDINRRKYSTKKSNQEQTTNENEEDAYEHMNNNNHEMKNKQRQQEPEPETDESEPGSGSDRERALVRQKAMRTPRQNTNDSLKEDSIEASRERRRRRKQLHNEQQPESVEQVTEQEKKEFFQEKNIVVNQATADTEDTSNMIKKPVKKHVSDEISTAHNDKIIAQQDRIMAQQNEKGSDVQLQKRSVIAKPLAKRNKVVPQNNIELISDAQAEVKLINEIQSPRNDGTQTMKDLKEVRF